MKNKFLTFSLIFLSLLFASSGFAWWDSDYSTRKEITINHGSDISDYSVLVLLDYESSMQSDFDDIRFIYSDDLTELPYYLQEKNDGVNASFWVKTNVSNGDKVIYVYYGNSSVSSNSNFSNAFIYSDDFNDNVINTDLWTEFERNGTINEIGGKLFINCTTYSGVNECSWREGAYSLPILVANITPDFYEYSVKITHSGDWVGNNFWSAGESMGFALGNSSFDNSFLGWNGTERVPTNYDYFSGSISYYLTYSTGAYGEFSGNDRNDSWGRQYAGWNEYTALGRYDEVTYCLYIRQYENETRFFAQPYDASGVDAGAVGTCGVSNMITHPYLTTNHGLDSSWLDSIYPTYTWLSNRYDFNWTQIALWLVGEDYANDGTNGTYNVTFDDFMVRKFDGGASFYDSNPVGWEEYWNESNATLGLWNWWNTSRHPAYADFYTSEEPIYTISSEVGFCGDGECSDSENCNSCVVDCGCESGEVCQYNFGTQVFECMGDMSGQGNQLTGFFTGLTGGLGNFVLTLGVVGLVLSIFVGLIFIVGKGMVGGFSG